ncbi:hypothetical protein M231_04788, partial [Tremella mesenterica]
YPDVWSLHDVTIDAIITPAPSSSPAHSISPQRSQALVNSDSPESLFGGWRGFTGRDMTPRDSHFAFLAIDPRTSTTRPSISSIASTTSNMTTDSEASYHSRESIPLRRGRRSTSRMRPDGPRSPSQSRLTDSRPIVSSGPAVPADEAPRVQLLLPKNERKSPLDMLSKTPRAPTNVSFPSLSISPTSREPNPSTPSSANREHKADSGERLHPTISDISELGASPKAPPSGESKIQNTYEEWMTDYGLLDGSVDKRDFARLQKLQGQWRERKRNSDCIDPSGFQDRALTTLYSVLQGNDGLRGNDSSNRVLSDST